MRHLDNINIAIELTDTLFPTPEDKSKALAGLFRRLADSAEKQELILDHGFWLHDGVDPRTKNRIGTCKIVRR